MSASIKISGVMLFLIFLLTSCGDVLTPEERNWLNSQDKPLRFVPAPDYPPYSFEDENGKYVGISNDYFRLLEERLGVKFEWVKVKTWKELLEKLRSGDVDLTGMAVRTLERSEYLNFTSSYITVPNILVSSEDEKEEFHISWMKGKRVGVVEGYAVEQFLEDQFPALGFVKVPDEKSGLEMVQDGKLDAMVAGEPIVEYLKNNRELKVKKGLDVGFDYELAIASRKGLKLLNAILEKGLSSISPSERRQIKNRWQKPLTSVFIFPKYLAVVTAALFLSIFLILLGKRRFVAASIILISGFVISALLFYYSQVRPSRFLTKTELDWISANSGRIDMAPAPEYPPVDFVEKNRETGYSMDLFRIIMERTGLRFNIVRYPNWNAMMDAAMKGSVDVVSSIAKSPDRSEYLVFTSSYVDVPSVIVVKDSVGGRLKPELMGGMKIAFVKGYAVGEYMKNFYPELTLVPVDSDYTGLKRVHFGNVDAMFADEPVFRYLFRKKGFKNLRVAGRTGYHYSLGYGIRKEKKILRDIIDKALLTISVEDREFLEKKWIEGEDVVPGKRDFVIYAICGLFVSLSALFALKKFFYRSRA